jgi:hypothetical protein
VSDVPGRVLDLQEALRAATARAERVEADPYGWRALVGAPGTIVTRAREAPDRTTIVFASPDRDITLRLRPEQIAIGQIRYYTIDRRPGCVTTRGHDGLVDALRWCTRPGPVP